MDVFESSTREKESINTQAVRRQHAKLVAAVGCVAVSCQCLESNAYGTDYVFTKNTAWTSSGNWTPTLTTPTPADELFTGLAVTMTLSSTAWTVGDIQDNTAGMGTLANNGSSNSSLTFPGYSTTPTTPLISISNGSGFRFSSTGTSTGTLGIILQTNGAFFVDTNGSLTIAATITESGGSHSIAKTGNGTLYLTNTTNSFTGGIVVNAGTLSEASSLDSGPVGSTVTLNGGTLSYTGNISTNATRYIAIGSFGGTIDVGTGSVTQNGTISGVGGLTKIGTGTLAMAVSNTYQGGTVVNAGTLEVALGSGAVFGSSASTNPIVFAGGAIHTSSDLLNTPLSTNRPFYIGNTAAATTGTFGVASSKTFRIAGAIQNSSMGGVGSFVKTDAGTLSLEGINTYTGATTVLGGTLLANNATSSTGTGPVNVGDGINAATLGGSGLIPGSITVNTNSTLAPGVFTSNSYTPGTLTTSGSLSLATGTTIVEKVSSTAADATATGGTVSFAAGTDTVMLSLVAVGGFMPTGGRINFITFPIADPPVNFTATTPSGDGTFRIDPAAAQAAGFDVSGATIDYDPSFGDIYISGIQNLPEPTVGAFLVLGVAPLLRRRRQTKASTH